MRRLLTPALAVGVLAFPALIAFAWATAPTKVAPTLLARGTYDDFKVKTEPKSPLDIHAKSKSPVDVVVRRHDYAPGGSTGWHRHPGPVFITVTSGTLTYYLAGDPCTPHVVRPGEGIVDDGTGHMVNNDSAEPAQDVSVIMAPVGGDLRTDMKAPEQSCSP